MDRLYRNCLRNQLLPLMDRSPALRLLEKAVVILAVAVPVASQAQSAPTIVRSTDEPHNKHKIRLSDDVSVVRQTFGSHSEFFFLYATRPTDKYCTWKAGEDAFQTKTNEGNPASKVLSNGLTTSDFAELATMFDQYTSKPDEADQVGPQLVDLMERVLQECTVATPTLAGLKYAARREVSVAASAPSLIDTAISNSAYYPGSGSNQPIPGTTVEIAKGVWATPVRYMERDMPRQLIVNTADIMVTYSTPSGGVPAVVMAYDPVGNRSCRLAEGAPATRGAGGYATEGKRVATSDLEPVLAGIPKLTGDPDQPEAMALRNELSSVIKGNCFPQLR